jgi:hypothetical protein
MQKTEDLQKNTHTHETVAWTIVSEKRHKFPEILFSPFPIFLPTRQNPNHNDQRQTTCIITWHQKHPIFHNKLKNLGKKKKNTHTHTHTCERDLVLGPVAVEVVDCLAGHAPLVAKHLLSRANRNLFDPLYTDVGCCYLVEDLISIYRQMMEDCKNQTIRDDSHGLMRE